jgi:hypothetical protein
MSTPDFIWFYDLHFLWAAGKVALEGGNPYELSSYAAAVRESSLPLSEQIQPFPHPPWTLLFYAVLASFSFQSASTLMAVINIVLAGYAFSLCSDLIKFNTSKQRIFCIFALILFPPFYSTLINGQINLILWIGLLLFISREKDSPFLASLGLVLTLFKPHILMPLYLACAIFAFSRRSYRLVLYGLSLTLSLVLSTELIFPGLWLNYFRSLDILSQHLNMPGTSVNQILYTYLNVKHAALLTSTLSLLLVIFLTLQVDFKQRIPWELFISISLLGTPYLWSHSFIMLGSTYLWIVAKSFTNSERITLYSITLLALLGIFDLLQPITFAWFFALLPLIATFIEWCRWRSGSPTANSFGITKIIS